MTAVSLLESLRARGVHLRAVGDRIRYKPVSALSTADLDALRQHKAEVLRLLSPAAPGMWERSPGRWSIIVGGAVLDLDQATVAEALGPDADEHSIAMLKFDIGETVAHYQAGVLAGELPPRLLVRGRPLADWLSLADLARLLLEAR